MSKTRFGTTVSILATIRSSATISIIISKSAAGAQVAAPSAFSTNFVTFFPASFDLVKQFWRSDEKASVASVVLVQAINKMGIILWNKAWKFVNRVILMSWTHGEGVLSKNMHFHFSMYIALYLKYTVIHKNDSIFWVFFHINFHYQELMVIFAKYDDFIMKHTDSMYQNAVYGKCIVNTETLILFWKHTI